MTGTIIMAIAVAAGFACLWPVAKVQCMNDKEREKYGHGPRGEGRR